MVFQLTRLTCLNGREALCYNLQTFQLNAFEESMKQHRYFGHALLRIRMSIIHIVSYVNKRLWLLQGVECDLTATA